MLFLSIAAEIMQREEQVLSCNMPDTDDILAYENQDEEAIAMVEESTGIGMSSIQLGTLITLFM